MAPLVLAIVAVVAGIGAWLVDRRRRIYADHPTTPAAAVFAGRNEVKGRVWSPTPLAAHRTATRCVWWQYELEEEREHTRTVTETDSQGRTRTRTETYREWHTIDEQADATPSFEVIDETGRIEVRPAGARVEPSTCHCETFRREDDRGFLERMFTSNGATGRYRETEQVLAIGEDVFVVGEAVMDDATATPVIMHGDHSLLISVRSDPSRRPLRAAAPDAAHRALLCRRHRPGHRAPPPPLRRLTESPAVPKREERPPAQQAASHPTPNQASPSCSKV